MTFTKANKQSGMQRFTNYQDLLLVDWKSSGNPLPFINPTPTNILSRLKYLNGKIMNLEENPISPDSPNDKYTGGHSHPVWGFDIDFVSYDRFDDKHDLFIFAYEFLNEEFEKNRVDSCHIFVKTLNSLDEMEKICEDVMIKLGEDFKVVPYFKEKNSRIICGRIVTYLKSINSQKMYLHSENNDWILKIRKKDFKNASKIALSNIVEK